VSHLLCRCCIAWKGASSPFVILGIFLVICFCLGLALDHNTSTYASYVVGITDMNHQAWLVGGDRVLLTLCLSWPQTIILWISTSWVAGITRCVIHYTQHDFVPCVWLLPILFRLVLNDLSWSPQVYHICQRMLEQYVCGNSWNPRIFIWCQRNKSGLNYLLYNLFRLWLPKIASREYLK
jgi:hypothetical protein